MLNITKLSIKNESIESSTTSGKTIALKIRNFDGVTPKILEQILFCNINRRIFEPEVRDDKRKVQALVGTSFF